MRLIYDLRILGGRMHGMARYALELLNAMLKADPGLNVVSLILEADQAEQLPQDSRIKHLECNLDPYGINSQILMPGLLKKIEADLYHCPFYAPPLWYNRPMVLTIHDLIHLRFPRDHGLKHRLFYRYVVKPAARKARAVFTVSRHSKNDLVELLGLDPQKIIITPNAVADIYQPLEPANQEQVRRSLGWPQGYILGVGNPKPHKNLGALVSAHNLLKKSPPSGLSFVPPLVLVGVGPGDLPQVEPGPDLVMIPDLQDEELRLAYAAAQVVVVPSLYEGFGLPALEALACGAPLLASDQASLPEVVGKAGLLCPPTPHGLSQALGRLLGDPDLRKRMSQDGPLQARKFTWAETARKTLEVYRRIKGEG